MGACGLIYEYVLSVLGNYLMGTSYEEIFIIIGIMMFAMGIGALLQRVLEGNLFEKFLLLEIMLGLVGGFSATIVYALFATTPAYKVVLYLFALAIGGMIGLEIPLLIRINEKYSQSLRVNLSEILCMDYIGALLGALFFTYFLLTHFSLTKISFLLGITNVLIGFISLLVFRPFLDHFIHFLIFTVVTLLALFFGFFHAEEWSRWSEQRYYNDPIETSITSKFQHITLTKGKRELNLFINGHLQFSSSDEFIYHELLVIPSMLLSEKRDRVLILGGGDGLALREVLKWPDVKHVDLVDLDPVMIRLATENAEMIGLNEASFHDARIHRRESNAIKAGERISVMTRNWREEFVLDRTLYPIAEVNVFLIDADLFIREIDGNYDRIFIDLPDPSSLELAKLYSRDFYTALMNRLAPDGFLVIQSTSPHQSRNAYYCIGKTLEKSGYRTLPFHEYVPSFGEWGWFLCWRQSVPKEEFLQTFANIKTIPVPTRYLTPDILNTVFIFPKYLQNNRRDLEVNSKMSPVLWTYYRRDWRYGPDS